MSKFDVPEYIRKLKPKNTIVKKLNNKFYYVYEYSRIKDEKDKKWYTKMGKMIGKITENEGFVPNDNYNLSTNITSLDLGQYLLTIKCSKSVLEKLKLFFNPEDANRIYLMAVIHFVNKFTYLTNIKDYYDQSYLNIGFPNMKMGYKSLSKLLDSLGRRQTNVIKFQQYLINNSSGEIAIDGHVVPCSSHENDLAEYGNKFRTIKEMQINILMAYDVNSLQPLLSRAFEGGMLDKTSVQELLQINDFKNILFIVDKGFYSSDNIELFSKDGNEYIIPLGQNLKEYKKVTKEMKLDKIFVYERNKKVSSIEYKEIKYNDKLIYVYRDLNQNAIDKANYLKNMKEAPEKYTEEKYNEVKDFFGVIVLQTNSNKSPSEIFTLYKKRWRIETFYDYFKNGVDFNTFQLSDYYLTQGLAFIMLIVGLIHKEVKEQMKKANINKSLDDILLKVRFLKAHNLNNTWKIANTKKEIQAIFNALDIDFQTIKLN